MPAGHAVHLVSPGSLILAASGSLRLPASDSRRLVAAGDERPTIGLVLRQRLFGDSKEFLCGVGPWRRIVSMLPLYLSVDAHPLVPL